MLNRDSLDSLDEQAIIFAERVGTLEGVLIVDFFLSADLRGQFPHELTVLQWTYLRGALLDEPTLATMLAKSTSSGGRLRRNLIKHGPDRCGYRSRCYWRGV